ncbi:MAG: methyltransferase domain-containing protein [Actinomycetota bacterium]
MDRPEDATAGVTSLFDEIAEAYDQSGVAFFAPIAEGLVDLMDLAPGERVADVGCGRGAVTFPAARAVGPTGSITAVDISPEERRGLLYEQVTQVLEQARTDGGDIVLLQDVRYTLGAAASP